MARFNAGRTKPMADTIGGAALATLDSSDPGLAARVNFAAAWLFAETSMMNAENTQRRQHDYSMAYSDAAYAQAMKDAMMLAQTGALPPWAVAERFGADAIEGWPR